MADDKGGAAAETTEAQNTATAETAKGTAAAPEGTAAPASGVAGVAEAGAGGEAEKSAPAALPDWLKDVPEPFRGKDEAETIAKLNGAQKGFREHLSKFGAPVKDAAEFDFKPTEKTAPFLSTDRDNDLRDKALAVLATNGIGKMQGPAVLNGLMEMMLELEIMDPPVNPEKERAALIPEEAKTFSKAEQDALVDKRIQKNQAFMQQMRADGLDEQALLAVVSLSDTAAGNRFLEFVAGKMGAINPATGGNVSSPMTREALQKLVAETKPDDIEGQQRIQEGYRRLHGRAA